MPFMLRSFCLLLACALAACGRPHALTEGGLATGVIGGDAAKNGDLVTGFTVAIRNGNSDIKNDPSCSGVLIAPTVVLTAAHCVYEEKGPIPRTKIDVAFGPDGHTNNPQLTRAVREFRAAPGFLNITDPCPFGDCEKGDIYANFNPSDIALVRLASPAPAAAKAARIPAAGFEWDASLATYAAGYGYNVPLEDLSADRGQYLKQTGYLRKITRSIHANAGGEDTRAVYRKLYIDEDAKSGICHGDSGGPLFLVLEGEPLVVGIAAHAASADLDYPCAGRMDAYSDVSAYSEWIAQTLTQWGETTPPGKVLP